MYEVQNITSKLKSVSNPARGSKIKISAAKTKLKSMASWHKKNTKIPPNLSKTTLEEMQLDYSKLESYQRVGIKLQEEVVVLLVNFQMYFKP